MTFEWLLTIYLTQNITESNKASSVRAATLLSLSQTARLVIFNSGYSRALMSVSHIKLAVISISWSLPLILGQ